MEYRVTPAPVVRLLLVAAALLILPAGVSAQSLEEVDGLIRDGYMQEARAMLLEWEAANPRPTRQEAQRRLWFRAILTLDPAQAESTLRRLVLEYPGGTFTAQALQRLGQAAALRGDLTEAQRHYSVLIRDYPSSPGRVEAQNWMIRNREALAAMDTGPDTPPATVPPRSDREPAPPVRRTGVREETTPEEQPVSPTGVPADEEGGEYSAQIGAFSAVEGARRLADRVEAAGYSPRIVQLPGSAFFRVRVGHYLEPATARRLMAVLREAGFDAGLGTRGSEEMPVPG